MRVETVSVNYYFTGSIRSVLTLLLDVLLISGYERDVLLLL